MAFVQRRQATEELDPELEQDKVLEEDDDEPKYGIGVLAGLEWSPVKNAELTDRQKNIIKALVKKAARRDYPARLIEVIQTWEAPLSLDTPIPTPVGWKLNREIRAGDYVFGSNGRICSVTAVQPPRTERSYAVIFSDGSRIVAGESHLWSTTTLKERYARKPAKERSTKELFDSQGDTHGIAMHNGLVLADAELQIDPYVLGCWLGDGITATGEICGNESDLTEMLTHFGAGAIIRKKVSRQYGNYCLATIPGLRGKLYALGLLKNKRIPKSYLRASIDQRRALLQGLMDTDGWTSSRGQCGLGQSDVHNDLRADISELLNSLGIKHQFYDYDRKSPRENLKFWQTTFNCGFCAFRLKRKVALQKFPKENGRTRQMYIVSVEDIGERSVRCIAVDSKDHLFLAGPSMLPTHNCLFYRGFQFLLPQRGGGWIIPGESTGYGPSMQMDLALLPTNIYSARAQMIISALTRTVPNSRFAPQRADSDGQITAAESAEKFVKVIAKNNDLIKIQTDAARYLWTDGRFGYYSRFVKDGQRFGWEEDDEPDDLVPENEPVEEGATPVEATAGAATPESIETAREENPSEGETQVERDADEEPEPGGEPEEEAVKRTPRGQEVRTCHGKLELKLTPMYANDLCEVDVLQYEDEVDISRARGMCPWIADKIKASSGNSPAMGEISRLARQNVKSGMQSTYITSDSVANDVTVQRSWLRASYFMECEDSSEEERDELIEMFPNGCYVMMMGEEMAFARNESMDDCWAIGQAYSGDGQNRNAMGTSTLPIQKRLNNWLDLMNDIFVRTVPKKWMDSKAFAVEAIKQQTNVPGDIGSFKRQPGVPVAELIFVEPAVNPPVNLSDFIKEYSGPLAELLSGAYPALAGGDVGTADSGVAIATQRDSALGRLAPTWHQMKNAEATSMKQLVRWAAKCRDKSINEKVPGGEVITLEINDLKGNISVYVESDENFPETYTQRKNSFMAIYNDAAKNPQTGEILFNPANLKFASEMIGLGTDLVIPQVVSYEKQLGEIEVMLKTTPVPNPQVEQGKQKLAMMAQQIETGGGDLAQLDSAMQELTQLPPEVTSMPIDPECDDSSTEMMCCWIWINGAEGRKAKRANPEGFANVRLHFLDHKKAAADEAAKAGGQGKPPSTSINFKDVAMVDQNAADQILQKAGIQPTPPSPGASAPAPVPAGPGEVKPPAAPLPAVPPGSAGGAPKH